MVLLNSFSLSRTTGIQFISVIKYFLYHLIQPCPNRTISLVYTLTVKKKELKQSKTNFLSECGTAYKIAETIYDKELNS